MIPPKLNSHKEIIEIVETLYDKGYNALDLLNYIENAHKINDRVKSIINTQSNVIYCYKNMKSINHETCET